MTLFYLDFGGIETSASATNKIAMDVLCFMVVGLREHWKLPIGFFFVAGLDAAGNQGRIQGGGGNCTPDLQKKGGKGDKEPVLP